MANIKSAKKRAQLTIVNTLRNAPIKSGMKTSIRKFKEADSKESAAEALKNAIVTIDKAVTKGILHKNAAARKKSRLTKAFNKMA